MENLRKKEFYREKIIELLEEIEKPAILNYIYIIVSDVKNEDKDSDEE